MAKPNIEYEYIDGIVKWFRAGRPDEYQLPNGKIEYVWSHLQYPDEKGLNTIRILQSQGMKNVLKHDEDGWYVRWRRPASKDIRGRLVHFPPPEVIDVEGKKADPETYLVGNGSHATTKLEVYSHKTPGGGSAKAARWLGSKINTLIPYEREEPEEEESIVPSPSPKYNW